MKGFRALTVETKKLSENMLYALTLYQLLKHKHFLNPMQSILHKLIINIQKFWACIDIFSHIEICNV